MGHESLASATRIHVCATASKSGIAAYAKDFHQAALEPAGYVLADPDAVLRARGAFAPGTRFHIQLGIFQHRERLAMSGLARSGRYRIDATIHDPPFVTFPYFQAYSRTIMRLSRAFDWYCGSLGFQRRALERLSRAFVLSEAGRRAVQRLAPRANVVAIPHVILPERVWPSMRPLPADLLYFGFIGPGKGVEYALQLHRAILPARPLTRLQVVGQPTTAAAERFFKDLKREYRTNVVYNGYVPDDAIDGLFEQAGHVLLPYAQYKYVVPASGSAIHAVRRGRVVWTPDVNAMSELIRDGDNGFILSMDLEADARRLLGVLDDPALARQVSENARQSALDLAHYSYSRHFAPDDPS